MPDPTRVTGKLHEGMLRLTLADRHGRSWVSIVIDNKRDIGTWQSTNHWLSSSFATVARWSFHIWLVD